MVRISTIVKIDKKARELILLRRLEKKIEEMKKRQVLLEVLGGTK